MDQREKDEMIFTTVLSFILVLISLLINENFNMSYKSMIKYFGETVNINPGLMYSAPIENQKNFCREQLANIDGMWRTTDIF